MNRFHTALGFTIFVSLVAPAVAMWNSEGFGEVPYGGAKKVAQSEEVLSYEAQLADRRKKLRNPGEQASGAPTQLSELPDANAKLSDSSDTSAKKLPDSPDTQADKILDEFYRLHELGACSDSDEGATSPIPAAQPEQNKEEQLVDNKTVPAIDAKISDDGIKEPVANVPVPQIILPEGFDASSNKAVRGDNSTNGSNIVSEDEEEEASREFFVGDAAPTSSEDKEKPSASSSLIHPLEECTKIAREGEGELLISVDNSTADSDEGVQEASGNVGEEVSEEEVVINKIEEQVVENTMEEKVVLAPVPAPTLAPDVQASEVIELKPAPVQNAPELAPLPANGVNNNAQAPKNEPVVKPAQPATPAWKKAQGYFTANYLKKKDNSRDMSFENLNQHKLKLLATLILYAVTAGAVGGVVYGMVNWFKEENEPEEADAAVPVKRPMVMAPKA